MMLEAKGVRKSFDGREVLKGIDLGVEKGDVIAILGPSGSVSLFVREKNLSRNHQQISSYVFLLRSGSHEYHIG